MCESDFNEVGVRDLDLLILICIQTDRSALEAELNERCKELAEVRTQHSKLKKILGERTSELAHSHRYIKSER